MKMTNEEIEELKKADESWNEAGFCCNECEFRRQFLLGKKEEHDNVQDAISSLRDTIGRSSQGLIDIDIHDLRNILEKLQS